MFLKLTFRFCTHLVVIKREFLRRAKRPLGENYVNSSVSLRDMGATDRGKDDENSATCPRSRRETRLPLIRDQ